jgi:uncharacterized phage protein (TIGR02218 family)
MKTPLYETSPATLSALLATRSFVFADLYTFTTVNGGPVLRYAAADRDIAWGGNTWIHNGPAFDQGASSGSRPTGHWKVGLDVDSWNVTVAPRLTDPVTGAAAPDLIAGQPWLQAVRGGALDGATATVDRAYLSAWPNDVAAFSKPAAPVGVINIFTGRVAAVDVSRTQVGIAINSHLELLDISMPRRVFQAPCQHTLFDTGCSLVAASYAVMGTVAAGSTTSVIHAAISAPPGSGTYALGRIVFTSGANATFQRSIRSYLAGLPAQLKLVAPLSYPVAVGDAFTAYPGCDKQRDTCGLFGNTANFRGFPYIPAPELSV